MEVQRESIFISAIRSFCRMFFSVCGIFLAFSAVSIFYSLIHTAPMMIDLKTKVTYLPDATGKRELVAATAPVILQLNIDGVIGEPKSLDSHSIDQVLVDSRDGVLKMNRVKGILLHINSPGGSAVDSDNIYRMLKAYKEQYHVPIFAYIDGLCASGGMYIACAADKIYASPSSVVGSVGVIMGPFFNVSELLTKAGVLSKTLTEGLDKDMMNPFRPWKEGDDASIKTVMAYLYNRFVDIVAENRPNMDKNKLISEYGANVFDPIAAQKLGYIDFSDASRNETLAALLQEANIDASKPYQVVSLDPKNEWLSQFFDTSSPLLTGKIEHRLDLGTPQIRDPFAYLYQPYGN